MKKYIYASALLILTSACLRVEEIEQNTSTQDAVKMQLTASIEIKETETKTFLDGEPVASVRNTYWLPEDEIAVVGNNGVGLFQNVKLEMDKVALFEGEVVPSDEYYALYPYSAYFDLENGSHSFDDGTLDLNIPSQQAYIPGTFATDVVPMVVKFKPGNTLNFKNVCGGFVLKLTGDETIVSTSLVLYDSKGDEANISGHFRVYMDTESYEMKSADDAEMYVSIDCGDGIKLSPDSPTSFHFVLPPAVYNGFKANFISSDGKTMVIKSDNELNIRRSNITYAPSLTFEDNVDSNDLSRWGTSNSYIITEPGTYSFAANVIGNGMFGLMDGANFHTDTPFIQPASAEILWQDKEGVITDLQLSGERVRFIASGKEGNALVAVKDAFGTILWSWHIWVTDTPKEITYETEVGSYKVLDRNIGAVRAEDSSEIDNILYFQWGRKDPLPLNTKYWTEESVAFTLLDAIQKPTVMSTNYFVDHQCSTREWMDPNNNNLWQKGKKTIYDPCPLGYKVVDPEVFVSIDSSPSEGENGYGLRIAGADAGYFPITGHYDGNGDYREDYMSHILTSENGKSLSIGVGVVNITNSFRSAAGVPVRCMKDEALNMIFEPIEIVDVTSASVSISSGVYVEGEVYGWGFVYGTSSDVNLNNGTEIACSGNDLAADIDGLSAGTIYYVRVYVMNSSGTHYGHPKSFMTPNIEGLYDLSMNGTSNSYIVSLPGTYFFDATVKGNGPDIISGAVSAELIWETYNISDAVTVGTVISDLSFDGTNVQFKVPDGYIPGNALVAVKDEDDQIIWSWHIWVSDFDPANTGIVTDEGVMIMDRNLGALNNSDDVLSFGLFYQWGRKDPFVGCGNISDMSFANTAPAKKIKYIASGSDTDLASYAESHPYVVISDSKWNAVSGLWDEVKTINDPCPVGWRVPDASVFNGLGFKAKPGYTMGLANLTSSGSECYHWTCDYSGSYYANNKVKSGNVFYEYSIRCMKDAGFKVYTHEASDISDTVATLSGRTEVSDGTFIEERGFVLSTSNSSPKINHTDIIVYTCDTNTDVFTITVENLVPNQEYFVRAFSSGGYNVKYGAVKSFSTANAGNGEDFGNGGDYEWE